MTKMKTKKKTKKAVNTERSYSSDEYTLPIYMKEIGRIPLLSKDEEVKIAKLAAMGDKTARERLINSNLRFVITIAKKYRGQGLAFEDLISEGNVGLLNAAKNFDAEKGYRFITYAVWWIRQSIVRAINEKVRLIRLPNNKICDVSRMKKIEEDIMYEPGRKRETELNEIAALLNMPEEKASELIRISRNVISLDEPTVECIKTFASGENIEDKDTVSPSDFAISSVLKSELETALDDLEKRSAEVIRYRFGLGDVDSPMTLKEVGDRLNLTRERIRQLEMRALVQLKNSGVSKSLEGFLAS